MTSDRDAGAARAAAFRFEPLLICALALAAMAPELVAGLSLSDSFRYNVVWGEQFRDLVRAGQLYPRWLPHSWDGLGSPTFYYYPPGYFWVVALADAATLRLLPIGAAISLASALVLAGSGLAMRAWLRAVAAPRTAFWGAIAYMAAPYHLFDIYARGALAEAGAYVALPLIALAVHRLAEGRAAALPGLALAYALLVLFHLPLTLMASITLIPLQVAHHFVRLPAGRIAFLARALAAGLIGIGLAALYLVPAFSLLDAVSGDALSGPYYQPRNWSFARAADWPIPGFALVLVPAWAALVCLGGIAAWAAREARFWAGAGLLALLIASGALPFLWSLPFVGLIQFPWRFLLIGEFAILTAFVLAAPRLGRAQVAAGLVSVCLAMALVGTVVFYRLQGSFSRMPAEMAGVRADFRDAPEYLPRGYPLAADALQAPDPTRVALPAVPLAAAAGARVRAAAAPDGDLEIGVASAAPTIVVVRRFAFPHWRVTDAAGAPVPPAPAQPARLLAWRVPAGASNYRVEAGMAPGERAGLAISALALTILLLLAARAAGTFSLFGARRAP